MRLCFACVALLPANPDLFAQSGQGAPAEDYFFVEAAQSYTGLGAEGYFTQHRPYVALVDQHSLAAMAVRSAANEGNVIEAGWAVAETVFGDSSPHLFVSYWVDGKPGSVDSNFVQVSSTRKPGMPVEVTDTPQAYDIEYFPSQGNWWIGYQGEWIGYFPGSLWQGEFTAAGTMQWFGEVSASSQLPMTWMGSGLPGRNPGAAEIANMGLYDTNGQLVPASPTQPVQTAPAYYAAGDFTGTSFKYGGPGATLHATLSNVNFEQGSSASGSFDFTSAGVISNSSVVLSYPALNYSAPLADNVDSSIILHAADTPPYAEVILVNRHPTGGCSVPPCGTSYVSLTSLGSSGFPGSTGTFALVCGLCDNNPGENSYTSADGIVDPPNYLEFAISSRGSLIVTPGPK
jgi:hypothetical protein